jgi:hypothetical protein
MDSGFRLGRGYLNIPELLVAVQRAFPTIPVGRDTKESAMDTELGTTVPFALAPSRAYRELLYRPDGQVSHWIDTRFDIIARPGQRVSDPPQPGDIMLQVTLGQPGAGRCSILVDPSLTRQRASGAHGPPGWYAAVRDVAAAMNPLQRRILDPSGCLPPGQLLLRPRTMDTVDDVATNHELGENDTEDRTPVPVAVPDTAATEVEQAAMATFSDSEEDLAEIDEYLDQLNRAEDQTFPQLEGPEAEAELRRRVAAYEKQGKTRDEAILLAMDDMFAERVKKAGGQRVAGTLAPKAPPATTYLRVSRDLEIEGRRVPAAVYNAAIDDGAYNCHSYTFHEAKQTKMSTLRAVAKKIPKEAGKDMAGKAYYDSADLLAKGIHFNMGRTAVIMPRWVSDGEARELLKGYQPLAPKAMVKVGDIVVYSTNGDLPHSGRITKVDPQGRPVMVRSKWGLQSLFEHPPQAVPSHYGKPSYYRKIEAK